jgi:hypothetical protein
MQKVGDLRTQKMGWGAIAKELGFALGLVVSEVQRVRLDMWAEANRVATEGVVTPERALAQSQSGQAPHSNRTEKTPAASTTAETTAAISDLQSQKHPPRRGVTVRWTPHWSPHFVRKQVSSGPPRSDLIDKAVSSVPAR